jgi:hypothetical protein
VQDCVFGKGYHQKADRAMIRIGRCGGYATLALFGAALPVMAQEFQGPDGSTATFYGQLNLGYLSYDDGQQSIGEIVDNANSNSRAGFWLAFPFADGSELKFNTEIALGFYQSNALTMAGIDQWYDWDKANIRKVDLSYMAAFGTLFFGQGSMATDGVAETDFSGTTVIGYSDFPAVAGGFAFRQADGTLSSITVGKVFPNLDGSRRGRLRYDSPAISGLTLSVAAGEDWIVSSDKTYYDAAIRYAQTYGELKVGAAIGYSKTAETGKDDVETLLGSLAVLHQPTGLNLALASGAVQHGGDYIYLKAGWIGDLIAAGTTAVAVEYMSSSDLGVTDGDGSAWGVMAVQKLDDYQTELYLGYREYALDQTAATYQDSRSVMVGARWKF